MGHYLINTTFRCQLKCPYCLIPHIKVKRDAPEHSWSEWFVGLRDNTPPGSILDFAGGDPLLFPNLALLLRALGTSGRMWAITTNALATEAVDELVAIMPPGNVIVNISDHPGNGAAMGNIEKLQNAFRVVFNRVDAPEAGHKFSDISSVIPYQSWREGTELDGIRRWCDSGTNHWVADPSGDVFRCNPAMATAQEPIGNLFHGGVVIPEPTICETGCSTCYSAVGPAAWHVNMREL